MTRTHFWGATREMVSVFEIERETTRRFIAEQNHTLVSKSCNMFGKVSVGDLKLTKVDRHWIFDLDEILIITNLIF